VEFVDHSAKSIDTTMLQSIAEGRRTLLRKLFPDGVPKLWCPPITHYRADGSIDRERTELHLAWLSRWVGGLLAAGSTSDGWELDEERHKLVTQLALEAAEKSGFRVLIGLLQPGHSEVLRRIAIWTRSLGGTSGGAAAAARLANRRVCGFAVCPPTGASLPAGMVEASLDLILQTGAPIALYQLPQVTGYEMSPELVGDLAARHSKFLLFKDSGGKDIVANSRRRPAGVFLFRGAEGDYTRCLAQQGGPYYGWLLSSANAFAAELHEMLELLESGNTTQAHEKSARLASVMTALFQCAANLPEGNPFANANKAAEHFYAHGGSALQAPLPRFSSGRSLPLDFVRQAGEVLGKHGLLPERGYLP